MWPLRATATKLFVLMRFFLFLLVFCPLLSSAQFNYAWLAIDYQNLWNLGGDVVETDSLYILNANTGTPWDPLYGQFILFDKNSWETQFITPGLFPSYVIKVMVKKEDVSSSTLVVCGYYYNGAIEPDSVDIFLLELDLATLDTLRLKKFGLPGRWDNPYRMILTQDGGVAITGWSFVSDQQSSLFLFKADSLWNEEYFKLYTQNPSRNHFGNSLVQTPDGGFIIVGCRRTDQVDLGIYKTQAIILKVDVGGELEYWKNFLPQGNEHGLIAVDLAEKENGDYIAVGNKIVSPNGIVEYMQFWAFEFDSGGEIVWSDTYWGDHQGAQWESIHPAPDGMFLVGGYLRENPHYVNDTLYKRQYGSVGKLSPEGELVWHRLYTNEPLNKQVDIFWNTIPTSDGGILCVGTTRGDSLTHQDVWAVKLDEWGCYEPGCEGPTEVVEVDVAPMEVIVYPNPASDKFTLKLYAPLERNAVLQLFNAMGQLIKTYTIPAGYVEYHFPLQDVPIGLYFYSLSADGEIIASGKLIKE